MKIKENLQDILDFLFVPHYPIGVLSLVEALFSFLFADTMYELITGIRFIDKMPQSLWIFIPLLFIGYIGIRLTEVLLICISERRGG